MIRKLECLKLLKMLGQIDPFQISQGSGRRDRKDFSKYLTGKTILKD